MTYIAHTRNAQGRQHNLEQHLRQVAEEAARFAATFGGETLAHYLGLWHDLGKFNPAFQQYLLDCEAGRAKRGDGPDHKAAGCLLARLHGDPLVFPIQGHHGGLHETGDVLSWLTKHATDPATAALATARRQIADLEPEQRLIFPDTIRRNPWASELFIRFLFSALVDADYLDTEAHFNPTKGRARRSSPATPGDLWPTLERAIAELSARDSSPMRPARQAIYTECVQAAALPPGLFRLAVPTGGGKTLSGLAFALRHALQYGLDRVIVAVPFISITEQTANVYRRIFDDPADEGAAPVVLEHHSGGDPTPRDNEDFHPQQVWQRLAAENWDAPIIVTTTVQLLESLFAASTTRCRKLHRLARSVIILDEAQALPPALLQPILDVLEALARDYGSTVVFSTATQPVFDTIPAFANLNAQDIIHEPARYFAALKRVDYDWHLDPALSWEAVAGLMEDEAQALAILNTKRDALALLDALADPAALHLSTLLCGAHRRAVIEEVKRRLDAKEPCRLIATQVVEAGVDVDFPLVLRALAPWDSIIQAAGRCNRNGRLDRGRVVVFAPQAGRLPPGPYTIGTNQTRTMLGSGRSDPDDPAHACHYFQQLFATVNLDREGIQALRKKFDYPEVARRFRMIDDDTESVLVEYGPPEQQAQVAGWIARLRAGAPDARVLLRQLQPYTVALRKREADKVRDLIDVINPNLPGLGWWTGNYDRVCGLGAPGLSHDQLVI
jgi:CRISPR-associated endonuclease/helicase Cas3